jgi:hypothetical protein
VNSTPRASSAKVQQAAKASAEAAIGHEGRGGLDDGRRTNSRHHSAVASP